MPEREWLVMVVAQRCHVRIKHWNFDSIGRSRREFLRWFQRRLVRFLLLLAEVILFEGGDFFVDRVRLGVPLPRPHQVSLFHFVFQGGMRYSVVASGPMDRHLASLDGPDGFDQAISVVVAVFASFGSRA